MIKKVKNKRKRESSRESSEDDRKYKVWLVVKRLRQKKGRKGRFEFKMKIVHNLKLNNFN